MIFSNFEVFHVYDLAATLISYKHSQHLVITETNGTTTTETKIWTNALEEYKTLIATSDAALLNKAVEKIMADSAVERAAVERAAERAAKRAEASSWIAAYLEDRQGGHGATIPEGMMPGWIVSDLLKYLESATSATKAKNLLNMLLGKPKKRSALKFDAEMPKGACCCEQCLMEFDDREITIPRDCVSYAESYLYQLLQMLVKQSSSPDVMKDIMLARLASFLRVWLELQKRNPAQLKISSRHLKTAFAMLPQDDPLRKEMVESMVFDRVAIAELVNQQEIKSPVKRCSSIVRRNMKKLLLKGIWPTAE